MEYGNHFGFTQAEEDTKAKPTPQSVYAITILITDVDDEPPRCNLSLYNAKIVENSQRLIPLSFTNAQDLYVYDNDEVNLSFLNLGHLNCCFFQGAKRGIYLNINGC